MGSNVRLEVGGQGPAVLFLHGMPTTWDVLRPIADACTGVTTLLAALPGYGSAPAWGAATTVVAIAEAIEEAVLAAGFKGVKIVGFSGGAHHALQLATRGILEVPAVAVLGGIGDLSDEERAGMRGFATMLRSGPIPPGLATARFLSPAFAAKHPEAVARVEAWGTATAPDNLARELDAIADAPPLLPALASYRGPLLARTGLLDLAAPPTHAKAIAAACARANAKAQIVDGSGHALLEEDRDATIAAVLGLLRSV